MTSAPIEPDLDAGSMQGWMCRQMERMNHRLDELQRSIKQLQQELKAKD